MENGPNGREDRRKEAKDELGADLNVSADVVRGNPSTSCDMSDEDGWRVAHSNPFTERDVSGGGYGKNPDPNPDSDADEVAVPLRTPCVT